MMHKYHYGIGLRQGHLTGVIPWPLHKFSVSADIQFYFCSSYHTTRGGGLYIHAVFHTEKDAYLCENWELAGIHFYEHVMQAGLLNVHFTKSVLMKLTLSPEALTPQSAHIWMLKPGYPKGVI